MTRKVFPGFIDEDEGLGIDRDAGLPTFSS
jgi:hypothetical protein